MQMMQIFNALKDFIGKTDENEIRTLLMIIMNILHVIVDEYYNIYNDYILI